MPLVGNPNKTQNIRDGKAVSSQEKGITGQAYVGELYVNRKQIYKAKGKTYEEAERQARREANKYPTAKTTIVVRKLK